MPDSVRTVFLYSRRNANGTLSVQGDLALNEAARRTARLLKHSTTYAIGNIARRLVGFLMLPIYTRYLTPADYGVVGLLTFALAIMEPLFGARLGEALPKYYFQCDKPELRNSVISTALIITGSVSLVTSIASFVFRSESSQVLFGTRAHALEVGWFGIQILTQAIEYYGLTYLRILQRPKTFLAVNLSKLVIQIILNIILVVRLHLGVMGVVISSVSTSALFGLGLTVFTLVDVGVRFNSELAKTMFRFCWPLWLSSLSSLYISSGGTYFLRIFRSLTDVGLYALASRYAAVLSLVVWASFDQYWETERFKHYGDPNGRKVYSNVFRFISVLLAASGLCLLFGAEPAIRVMTAPEFHKAHLAAPILIIDLLVVSLTSFARFGLIVRERTRSLTVISYLTAVLITVMNFALIPHFGFVGAALALAGARFVQFLAVFVLSRRSFDMGIELRPVLAVVAILAGGAIVADILPVPVSIYTDIAQRTGALLIGLTAVTVPFWRTPFAKAQLRPILAKLCRWQLR